MKKQTILAAAVSLSLLIGFNMPAVTAFASQTNKTDTGSTDTTQDSSGALYTIRDSYMYEKADPTGNVLNTIPKDSQLTVTGDEEDGWVPISYNGENGYVWNTFLTTTRPAHVVVPVTDSSDAGDTSGSSVNSDSGSSESTTSAGSSKKKTKTSGTVYTNHGVNMRSAAQSGSSVVTIVPEGAAVQVTGEEQGGGWIPITYDGQAGYVWKTFLTGTGVTQNEDTATVGYAKSTLSVHKSTSWKAFGDTVETLSSGDSVTLLDKTAGSYVYVETSSGTKGWVNSNYLSE